MNVYIERDALYQPLQKIVNIISSRPRLPILTHVLLEIHGNRLYITATNLETEIVVYVLLENQYLFDPITISGCKFFDICRNLPEHSKISIKVQNNKFYINSGSSSFVLSTLPAMHFPKTQKQNNKFPIIISQCILKKMIGLTQFAMGRQDVRCYLNGMFLEIKDHTIRMVATDGHRLALCEMILDVSLPCRSVIIPRKGIIEVLQLLNIEQESVTLNIYDKYILVTMNNYIFSAKLIDAKFPEYRMVFCSKPKIFFEIERIVLKHALQRVSILSHIKLRIVSFYLTKNQLRISARNFAQEKSEEFLVIPYMFEDILVSFNVDYLIDIINVIDNKMLKFFLTNDVSSVQIEGVPKNYGSIYIIMPVRI